MSKLKSNSTSCKLIVDSKELPTPDSVDDCLKNFLENDIDTPNVARTIKKRPSSERHWSLLQNVYNKKDERLAEELIEKLNVSVQLELINEVKVYRITPAKIATDFQQSMFYFVHGGAFVFGKGISGLPEAIKLAAQLNIEVISVDYRMPPEAFYPAALNDVLNVYESLRLSNKNLIMGGTSAGGGLVMSAIHQMKINNQKLPQALFLGTPWSDLNKIGDSYYLNEGVDHNLICYDGFLGEAAKWYANEADLNSPFLSPIYGSFEGFPPTFLITGTRDLFLSNTIRVHTQLKQEGCEAELIVLEGIAHGDYMKQHLKASKFFFNQLQLFCKRKLSE